MDGISILEEVKKHFEEIGFRLNQSQIQNAVHCVYDFMNDEELLVSLIIRSLYPPTDYKEVVNDKKTREEIKKNVEKSEKSFIESSKL